MYVSGFRKASSKVTDPDVRAFSQYHSFTLACLLRLFKLSFSVPAMPQPPSPYIPVPYLVERCDMSLTPIVRIADESGTCHAHYTTSSVVAMGHTNYPMLLSLSLSLSLSRHSCPNSNACLPASDPKRRNKTPIFTAKPYIDCTSIGGPYEQEALYHLIGVI